ncbi:MAG: transposase [Thermodesulfobacteriota bacterium]|nr:transposase [Thermodesulfobacteriota bacterium]
MSRLSIAPFFPFRRIKIVRQKIDPEAANSYIHVLPDKRFKPICSDCGQVATEVHSWTESSIRDLNFATTRLWLTISYRKLECPHCQSIRIENLKLFDPYLRVTERMVRYIYQLCQVMTVSEVARHLGLNWKTVKAIDKHYLEQDFGQPDYNDLRILAVDEISIRKGHNYLTVVLDSLSGHVLYVGKDRKAKTLERFFNQLKGKQRKRIKAVAMDMLAPFIKAVKKNSRMR